MKKILIVLAFSSTITLFPALDQIRQRKFSSGIKNWTYNTQQMSKNYAHSPLELLNNTSHSFDVFENAFSNTPRSPDEQDQLNTIRNSLREFVERKKRETQMPIPTPTESIPPYTDHTKFASDLDEWHTKYMQIRHRDYANSSSTAIGELIKQFSAFENAAANITKSATEQETLNEVQQELSKLAENKKRDEQVNTAEQSSTQEFVSKLNQWEKAITQLKRFYAQTPLESINKMLVEFGPFEEASHETKITDQQQTLVATLHEDLKKLKTDKKLQQAFSKLSNVATPQDIQTFDKLLVFWNQMEAVRETIESDGLICATHRPFAQGLANQITTIKNSTQGLHPIMQQLIQMLENKLADEITNKYLIPGACPNNHNVICHEQWQQHTQNRESTVANIHR